MIGIPFDHTKSFAENYKLVTGRDVPQRSVRCSPGIVDARSKQAAPKKIPSRFAKIFLEAFEELQRAKR